MHFGFCRERETPNLIYSFRPTAFSILFSLGTFYGVCNCSIPGFGSEAKRDTQRNNQHIGISTHLGIPHDGAGGFLEVGVVELAGKVERGNGSVAFETAALAANESFNAKVPTSIFANSSD